jgi:hypothetical protein
MVCPLLVEAIAIPSRPRRWICASASGMPLK